MKKILGQIKIEKKRLKEAEKKINNISGLQKEIEKSSIKETTELLEICLLGAIKLNASDIHVEPKEEKIKLRLRIDGILYDVFDFNLKIYKSLLSRIKLLSGIKINITDKSQDGRFTTLLEKNPVEIRSSTLPSEYGESIVLRILDPKSLIEIEELGIREDMLEVFKKQIQQPNGLIIVTGPTGSGKTTTLYAILKRIQSPEIKIITIEDPIEYHLKEISQTQVNPKKGYDFPNGLKAIVRQDPDVILVGEIRDFETAKIALQASLTGHLVLTTLHTNDALGTIVRIQALGETVVNIAPAINLAIGQRLVRKVCKKCLSFSKAKPDEINLLKKDLKGLPKTVKIPNLDKEIKLARTKGCAACNFTGYKGRVGIFEFFLNDPEMESFILKSPSISDLRKKTKEKGMLSMREDGLIKVLNGITTIEEVNRITKEE